jgi:hypothetical protein
MTRDIPSGVQADRIEERGMNELMRRHEQALADPERQPSRQLLTGRKMWERVLNTPPHLRPGRKEPQ